MSLELTTLTSMLKSDAVKAALGARQTEALGALSRLRKAVNRSQYTEPAILDAIFKYPDLLALCYSIFSARFNPIATASSGEASPVSPSVGVGGMGRTVKSAAGSSSVPVPAILFDRKAAPSEIVAAANGYFKKVLKDDDVIEIFTSFVLFTVSTRRTNFFKSNIVSLAFNLDPALFLGPAYREPFPAYSVLFILSAEARGFHVRIAEIARGGIRLIKSGSSQAYANNVSSLFDECFNLASTQQQKNHELVEGGEDKDIERILKGASAKNVPPHNQHHLIFSFLFSLSL
jgi:glutamate dehydrogenase